MALKTCLLIGFSKKSNQFMCLLDGVQFTVPGLIGIVIWKRSSNRPKQYLTFNLLRRYQDIPITISPGTQRPPFFRWFTLSSYAGIGKQIPARRQFRHPFSTDNNLIRPGYLPDFIAGKLFYGGDRSSDDTAGSDC